MKQLKTIVDTLTAWLTSTTAAAIKHLSPRAEEAGYEIGTAILNQMENGMQRAVQERSSSFASSVIEVEPLKIEGPAKKRKARGKKS